MWRVRLEYGKRAWLEARWGTVTISTRFDSLLKPYAILHSISRILHEEARKAPEGRRGDHVAGALGGRGFERRLEALIRKHGVTLDEPFRVDLGWLKLEKSESGVSVDVDREAAEDAMAPLGSVEWPQGVPWPALAPRTRVGDIRALLHLYCDTPWLRDLVESRALIGLGGIDESYPKRVEQLIDCHEELAPWGLYLRKPKSNEHCAPKPVVFAVFPFIHYARNPPHNLMLMIEDPGLHANTELLDAISQLLAALADRGASIVVQGEAADYVYRVLRERGVPGIQA